MHDTSTIMNTIENGILDGIDIHALRDGELDAVADGGAALVPRTALRAVCAAPTRPPWTLGIPCAYSFLAEYASPQAANFSMSLSIAPSGSTKPFGKRG